MNFKQQIITKLKNITKLKEIPLEIPPNPLLGDFAFPCFVLSKKLKKSPNDIAKELVDHFKTGKFIEKVTANGPYLNFFINKKYFIQSILDNSFTIKPLKNNKTIMVEYCAPNTNKPLHLGHLRNIFIGNSVSLILKFLGNEIIQANLINDRGIHICKSMLAYKKWGNNKKPNKKTDHFVGDYYVMFQKKKNEQLEKKSYDLLRKYEQNDKETLALWKKMNDWALKGFDETYKKLGIKFDKNYYESKYYKKAKKLIQDYYKKGVFKKDNDSNIAAEFDGKYRVVLREDGTSVYITQDIYLAQQKFKDYKLDKSIYVVANEQNLHFQHLFKILQLMGYKWYDKCYHLGYGLVNLPEGRMKSREGKVIDADDIIEEVTNLAKKEIKKRHKLNETELKKRSRAIGLAALRFLMLKHDAFKDIIFNPEESIKFEGETGPYIQYTHARICSILRKYKKKVTKVNTSSLKNREDFELAKLLADFNEVIENSAQNYKPNLLCRYLLDLSQKFNNYYRYYPIMTEKEESLRKARLMLACCVKEVLKTGLSLLGIDAVEEM